MALTAPRIVASIYAVDRGFGVRDIPNAFNGRSNTFTNVEFLKFYPAPVGFTSNGVTMNSIIEQMPNGLVVNSIKYYTDSTTTQIVNNGS